MENVRLISIGDQVKHKYDITEKVETVINVFPWLGHRKIVTESFKDWEEYFIKIRSPQHGTTN